jgi:thiamine-phosphate pyrophosphorylase
MGSAAERWRPILNDALAVYVLTDRALSKGRSEIEVVQDAIAGGATAIQLRWKEPSMRGAVEIARELKRICAEHDVLFVVNDRVDLALAVEADGVHIGEDDLPVAETRKIVGDRMIIGYSPPTIEEAVQAERDGADYLGVGPVYGTRSKDDAGAAIGTGRIAEMVERVRIPVVGIGGIDADNSGPVIEAGAVGVSVISAVVAQDDIEAATRALKSAVGAAVTGGDR